LAYFGLMVKIIEEVIVSNETMFAVLNVLYWSQWLWYKLNSFSFVNTKTFLYEGSIDIYRATLIVA